MIILFDVDGVLVHSRAYHLGLQKTVEYFSRRMGLVEPHTLTQREIDVFEAQSITVEWESSAISVAALLLERMRITPTPALSHRQRRWERVAKPGGGGNFWAALDALAERRVPVPRPDFEALARRVGAATPNGDRPSHAALRLFESQIAGEAWAQPLTPLLHHLLADCYDIDRSPTNQVVQNFAIGDEAYRQSYGLAPLFQGPALLETEDTPLLNAALRDRLLAERAAGRLHFALYTARPSLPPIEVRAPLRGYTPEAELALKLVSLNEAVPVIAFGKLEWAARQIGRTAMDFVKPSPVQALAAIAAARTGRELDALEAALAIERGQALPPIYAACAGEHVHVFEDSASSLRAVRHAVERLNTYGLGLTLTRHGIAPPDSPKYEPLSREADAVHADVNIGLATML